MSKLKSTNFSYRTMNYALVLTFCMICIMVSGCGSSSPSGVVKKFHAAVLKGDWEAVYKYCTPETADFIAGMGSRMQNAAQSDGKIKNIKENINGDKATVNVTYENGDPDDFELILVNGTWKVHLDMRPGSGK